jgi:hypothetical protein
MRKRSSLLLIVALGVALLYRNRHRTSLQRIRANVRAFDLPTAGMYDALVASVLSGLYRPPRRAAGPESSKPRSGRRRHLDRDGRARGQAGGGSRSR